MAPEIESCLAGIVSIAGVFSFGANPLTRGLGKIVRRNRKLGLERWVRPLGAGVGTRVLGSLVASKWRAADALSTHFPLAGWVPGSTEPFVVQERLLRGFDFTGLNVLLTMMHWAAEGHLTNDEGESYEEAFLELDLPLLVLAGDRDRMLPPDDARPAFEGSQSKDKDFHVFCAEEEEVHWGHLDLVLGRLAPVYVWPKIRSWMDQRSPTNS